MWKSLSMALLKIESTTKKNSPKMKTAMITTVVVDFTSFHEGVTTLRISERTSLRNWANSVHCPTTLSMNFDTGFFPCRLIGRSSPFAIANLVPILAVPSRRALGRAHPDSIRNQSGRGGGIRTPKFGFGDRQFSR